MKVFAGISMLALQVVCFLASVYMQYIAFAGGDLPILGHFEGGFLNGLLYLMFGQSIFWGLLTLVAFALSAVFSVFVPRKRTYATK